MHFLAETFKIGKSTLYEIIPEVCQIIYEEMRNHYLVFPQGNDWLHISHQFQQMWQFPNCLGALDTKQIHIKQPDNSGTLFRNYSGKFTIGLMAICDAIKRFSWALIGSYGKDYSLYLWTQHDLYGQFHQETTGPTREGGGLRFSFLGFYQFRVIKKRDSKNF